MSSASEPRQYPFTNDVGHDYHAPEKPPIHQEIPMRQDVPPNPIGVYFGATTVNTQQAPPQFQQPNNSSSISRTQPQPLTRERFYIPTKTDSLSSGFPYDPRVYSLISHDEWHLLSSDIVNASRITPSEDIAAWTTGVTAGTLSSPFTLVAAPWVGYYAGRSIHRKTVVKVVKERLERDGDMRSVLRRWNETTFMKRGFQAWLELPDDGAEIQLNENPGQKKTKEQQKLDKSLAKRFKIVIIPNAAMEGLIPQDSSFGENLWNRRPENSWSQQLVSPMETAVAEAPGNEYRDPTELQNNPATAGKDHTLPKYQAGPPPVELDGNDHKAEVP